MANPPWIKRTPTDGECLLSELTVAAEKSATALALEDGQNLNVTPACALMHTGVKRVTVIVKRGNKEAARLIAYRSKNGGGRVDN